jgi:hypothetical protein
MPNRKKPDRLKMARTTITMPQYLRCRLIEAEKKGVFLNISAIASQAVEDKLDELQEISEPENKTIPRRSGSIAQRLHRLELLAARKGTKGELSELPKKIVIPPKDHRRGRSG